LVMKNKSNCQHVCCNVLIYSRSVASLQALICKKKPPKQPVLEPLPK